MRPPPREGGAEGDGVGAVGWSSDQKESALTTSPLATVWIAYQAGWLIEFLMNFTLPSAKATLIPPGCRLLAVQA